MKVIYVSLIIAALVLSYPGTSQAQKVKKEGTFSLKCSGGNCIGSGIADCAIRGTEDLVVWGSVISLPICFTTTNLGKTQFQTLLRESGGTGGIDGSTDPQNTQTICATAITTAAIKSVAKDCKVIWHVDLIGPAIDGG